MTLNIETIGLLKKYSENGNMQKVFKKNIPKSVLEKFEKLNEHYKKTHGKDFIEIV